jgi:hypothetical protein
MADESDVENALVDIIDAAIYPQGPAFPSLAGYPVKIYAGWPVSATLEEDLKQGLVHVSVYPVPGSGGDVGQPFQTKDEVIVPAVHGLSAAIDGDTITVAGASTPGEYLTVVLGRKAYSYLTVPGDGPDAVAAGVGALIQADYPGTTVLGPVVTLSGTPLPTARLGAPVTMATRIGRQRLQFRIVIWAPTPEARTAVAKATDVALKRRTTVPLADTSQALVAYQGTTAADTYELNGLYRRDLIFNVTYDTIDTYRAFEITSVGTTLADLDTGSVYTTTAF